MVTRLLLAVGIGCALMCQNASAQPPAAEIKKTSTPPVIDGNGNDAVWANANVYDTDEFFIVEAGATGNPIGPLDRHLISRSSGGRCGTTRTSM